MSYIKSNDSSKEASEYFASGTDDDVFSVTLEAPQCIGNPTETAGYITFKRPGNAYPERDYFAAGQFKDWVVETVYGTDGIGSLGGSTCDSCVAGGINGVGSLDGTTTTGE